MDINVEVKENLMIRAFYLFFLISSLQFGVGTLGVSTFIFENAKQDAWVSILIAYGVIILTVIVMFIILNQYENADIFGIQIDVFGQVIGKVLGMVYVGYFGLVLITVLTTYIQIVKLFLYPTMPQYVIGFFILLLVIYSIFGGIRAIAGVAFIFFISSQFLLFLLYDPILRMEWGHFLPMFQASPKELFQSAKTTIFTMGGFEILFLLYPFIRNKEKAKLATLLGVTYTAIITLVIFIITVGYFGLNYISELEWSLLTLFKSVSFTFIQRVDYFVIVEWLMIVIPNNILLLWGMTYGLKRLFNIKQKQSIFIVAGIVLVATGSINYDFMMGKLTNFVSTLGFWIAYIYPLILLPCVLIRKKIKKSKGLNN